MKNWGGAATSDWAKQEAQWAKKAHTQGYSHFKTPQELGYRTEAAASKRYFPKLNKKGEWEQNEPGPFIHQTTHTPFEKPDNPPKAGVAPGVRAAFNQELREQAAQHGDRAPKALPRPAERRQRLQEKRVAATVEPTRKSSRVCAQANQASDSAAIPTSARDAVKGSALASAPNVAFALDQLQTPADHQISDDAEVDPSATAVSPRSTPAVASSSQSTSFADAASVIHTTSNSALGPKSVSFVPLTNAATGQAGFLDSETLINVNPTTNMKLSNGVAREDQVDEPAVAIAVLQASRNDATTNGSNSQTLLITWRMEAASARKFQAIVSGLASVKQEDDDSGALAAVNAVKGNKRKAEDDISRPAKKIAIGKIATGKKRKTEDEGSAPRKRPRVRRACKGCRFWRVKCDGATPCSMCRHRGITCVSVEDEDVEENVSGVANTSKASAPKPSTSKAGPSGTKKASAPPTSTTKPPKTSKFAASRPARGPVCNKCREKKTGCDREKPCRICNERGWECVYEGLDTVDKPEQSSAPGNQLAGNDQKKGHAASASTKQAHDLSTSSTVHTSNGTADDRKNLKRQREDDPSDRTDEPAAKRSMIGLGWELRLTEDKPDKTRTILPAISKWIVKGEHGFQEYQFNRNDFLTKRQMEKKVMMPEESKQDLADFGTATNDQRTQEESFHSRPSIKLVLPDHLKGFLVDDWENVTKNGLVVELPHSKATVDQILKDYVEYEKQHRQEGSAHMDILVETIEGLREYFDKALARILLYR